MREFAATQVFGERLGAGAVKGRRMDAGRWRMDDDGVGRWVWSETEESLAPTRAQARSFCRRRPKVGASRACLLSESGSQARQTARETRSLPCARLCPNVLWSLALDRRRPIRSFRCSHTCVHRPCMSLPDSTTRLCLCYCEPTTRAPRASTGPWATQLCSSSQPRAVWPTGIEAGQGKAGTHASARVAENGSGFGGLLTALWTRLVRSPRMLRIGRAALMTW